MLNIPYFQQFTKGSGVKVAVLDSELSLDHPEFVGKNIHYEEFIPSDKYNYHGTAVSSLIVGNTLGVAPEVELFHMKMLSDSYGSGKSWDRAISSALRHDVDIVCMSIGTKDSLSGSMNQSIQTAKDRGILLSAPSGNEGITILRNPANNPNVIAVGGIDLNKKTSKQSNKSKLMEAYAPSENIVVADNSSDLLYSKKDGTSFSNAIFVGQMALVLSYLKQNGKETKDIRELLALYNQKNRTDRKILDMKKFKEFLDYYFNL